MQYDLIIIGGGIVGLATALRVLEQRPNLKVMILEKESSIGQHQTGHNSGVIHSGIYYKPGSLKAQNCINGYKQLLEFCDKNNVQYELCGKIVVATQESQLPMLEELYHRGVANGLKDLRFLSKEEIREHEPHVSGIRAIHVPQTGIIDYADVIGKFSELVLLLGGEIQCGEEVMKLHTSQDEIAVETSKNSYTASFVVSCAGLMSDRVAKMTQENLPLRIIPFRGEYYKLKKEKEYLVKNLIYPIPDPTFPFLGVHFTRMINGGVEAGPNAVLAFKREGYKKSDFSLRDSYETLSWPGFHTIAKKYWRTGLGEFHRSFSKAAFVKALQKLIPEIDINDIDEGGSGVRAQACERDGGLVDDFLFVEEKRVLHVCNAPSPAATSSLAIGKTVVEKIINHVQ
ncbi:MAG: L-2-hydroxyglutarate oxidase [Bacteroidota bacterium]|mgnify:CR=1 FL=1